MKIVAIGAGQAGLSFVAKARSLDPDAELTLIGDEPVYPYQRPPLSKTYLTGDMPLERLLLRDADWFADNRITMRKGVAAKRIDRAAKQVVMADGETVEYDRLLLATGASARNLPDEMGGGIGDVHVIRNLAHADGLAPKMLGGKKVVVVGGGYIGLESAAMARTMGLDVTLIEAAERILHRVACEETSQFYRDMHTSRGVRIIENVKLRRLRESGGVLQAAVLEDGTEVPAEIALVGIGVGPNTALAEDAGLAIDNGVAVDEFCATSDPDIFAAGDCTSFPHNGARLRLESVPNAIHQAEIAAENVCGRRTPYRATPWFWSDQYDVKLQIAGLNAGYDEAITRRGEREGSLSIWYFRDEELLALDAMNDSRAYMIGRKIIEAGKTLPKSVVADAGSNLKDWLPRT